MSEKYLESRSVTCNVKGGLGNQLFQIFATIAYACRTGRKFFFLRQEEIGNRPSYWHSFFKNLEPFLLESTHYYFHMNYLSLDIPKTVVVHKEPQFSHSPIPDFPDAHVVVLDGYFQSRKYFADFEKKVVDLLWPDCRFLGNRNVLDEDRKTIGMHFRIGDYKPIQHFHPVMPTAYYVKALSKCLADHGLDLSSRMKVVYLCQETDLDDVAKHLEILTAEFPCMEFKRGVVPDLTEEGHQPCDRDWKEMALLSRCDWFVIPNSTFSWWAATLSDLYNPRSDDGVIDMVPWVYYPGVWFGPALWDHDTRDLTNQSDFWKRIDF